MVYFIRCRLNGGEISMNDLTSAHTDSETVLAEGTAENRIDCSAERMQESASIEFNALPSILRVQRAYCPPRITVASQMIMSGP